MATRTSEPTTAAQNAITSQRAGRYAQLEARLLRLPPPHFGVAVQRDIPIAMPDGVASSPISSCRATPARIPSSSSARPMAATASSHVAAGC